jgi:uncharacterized protein YggU (UPF0235/DUF167 family)
MSSRGRLVLDGATLGPEAVTLLLGKTKTRHAVSVRIRVRAHVGSSRSRVGGRYGEGVLTVRVTAPPLDGRANRAVEDARAEGFGVGRGAVRLLSGARARTKVLEADGADSAVLAALMDS